MSTIWRITLLGGLSARHQVSQETARFETRRTAALLALLTLTPGRPQARELLAERLWPDEDIEAVRDRFRHALAALRRALEPAPMSPGSIVIADRAEVRLEAACVTSDVAEFDAALGSARKTTALDERTLLLQRAAALYQGELLPGFYDEWIFPERERLANAFQRAIYPLAALLAARGELDEAMEYARRAVAADSSREEAHTTLMRLYAAAGRRSEVLRQFRELEKVLHTDGLKPTEEVRTLFSHLQTCAPSEALNAALRRSENGRAESPRPVISALQPSILSAPVSEGSGEREPDGGAVPLNSPYYVTRPTDAAFADALTRGDSIVLVKGARQIGKTSLLARGLHQARQKGLRVALTDFQKLTAEQLGSTDKLFFALAEMIADQLNLDTPPETNWNPNRGWNVNFERFLRREALGEDAPPVIWAMDEVDRLFHYAYSAEVFGLFRSWHNERALDPSGPWARLTLAIAYATEAHLFITDLNQSPFNVGTRLSLEDFTPAVIAALNPRYGEPLKTPEELRRFHALLGGHPYLTRCGLNALARDQSAMATLEQWAIQRDGVFGNHLRRMHHALTQDDALACAVRDLLRAHVPPPLSLFYRLRSAGVLVGSAPAEARFRCELYRRYLEIHLV